MASVSDVRDGLKATTVPDELAETLLRGASPLWLSSDTGAQLAGDLALCHPPLKRSEVRARAVGADDEWRITVVAKDRKGLLADSAAILSHNDFSITGASVATWKELDLALHALTVSGPAPTEEMLDLIGSELRAAGKGERPDSAFEAKGRAYVRRTGSANGDSMISVVAPDQPGLLAAVCRWFSDNGVSIEAAWIAGSEEANDVFVVDGDVDVAALERHLSEGDHSLQAVVGDMFDDARKAGEEIVRTIAGVLGNLLGRK